MNTCILYSTCRIESSHSRLEDMLWVCRCVVHECTSTYYRLKWYDVSEIYRGIACAMYYSVVKNTRCDVCVAALGPWHPCARLSRSGEDRFHLPDGNAAVRGAALACARPYEAPWPAARPLRTVPPSHWEYRHWYRERYKRERGGKPELGLCG